MGLASNFKKICELTGRTVAACIAPGHDYYLLLLDCAPCHLRDSINEDV